MKLGTWLLSLVRPFIAKVLISLGFSVVTITGMQVVISQVKTLVSNGVNTMPSDMLNIFLLAGGGHALGMIFGAITTKVLLWQIQSATKILGTNPG